jgi:hypothetical protein
VAAGALGHVRGTAGPVRESDRPGGSDTDRDRGLSLPVADPLALVLGTVVRTADLVTEWIGRYAA